MKNISKNHHLLIELLKATNNLAGQTRSRGGCPAKHIDRAYDAVEAVKNAMGITLTIHECDNSPMGQHEYLNGGCIHCGKGQ